MSDNISRRWRDGSLELDLPTFLLSEMFNCNHFIVSQTNPHIVPLLNLKKTLSRRWANLLELELRHRCGLTLRFHVLLFSVWGLVVMLLLCCMAQSHKTVGTSRVLTPGECVLGCHGGLCAYPAHRQVAY
jgi:hypothetical protein